MLDGIKSFFSRNIELPEQPASKEDDKTSDISHDPIHVAACALLLELAHADDVFAADRMLQRVGGKRG